MKRVIPVPAQRLESGTKAAPAAQSNTPVNGLRFHVSNAAGFGEAITEKAEVGRHPAKMEGDARDTTADLARGPRADRRPDGAAPGVRVATEQNY